LKQKKALDLVVRRLASTLVYEEALFLKKKEDHIRENKCANCRSGAECIETMFDFKEWERLNFYTGFPFAFLGMIPKTDLAHELNADRVKEILSQPCISYKYDDREYYLSRLEVQQATKRLTLKAMSGCGYTRYRELTKLIGSATVVAVKRRMSKAWDDFMEEYYILQRPISKQLPQLFEEHNEFKTMLRNEYNITFDEWVTYMILAFDREGKYIPFHTVPEVIECARRILQAETTTDDVSLYDIYIGNKK